MVLQTVQRIGPLLDLFSEHRTEVGVSEVASELDIARSSAHELLVSLVDCGLLQSPARGRYRLGWRLVDPAETSRHTRQLRTVAVPALRRLTDQTGETSHLGVLDHGQIVYLERAPARHMVAVNGLPAGTRLAPHASAMGKALLAALPAHEALRILGRGPLRAYTPHTVRSVDAVFAQLDRVRRDGLAVAEQEVAAEVACIGIAIPGPAGVRAAISISAPVGRLTANRTRYGAALQAAAQEIAQGATP